jgi:cyclopropane fatty-acyl-phospholipid synthase-like methyltransferase
MNKPFAESCAQNQQVILDILRNEFAGATQVLEIGSGTGQHAVFFGRALPHLTWQTSDVQDNHAGIQAWLADEALDNVLPPLALDVAGDRWPERDFDAVFSANTVHIMGWPEVEEMFTGIGRKLKAGGVFCLYGPFNYDGEFSSESNARFDVWLKERDPKSGIRDTGELQALGEKHGLSLMRDHEMPVNNRILVWLRD